MPIIILVVIAVRITYSIIFAASAMSGSFKSSLASSSKAAKNNVGLFEYYYHIPLRTFRVTF